MHLPQTMRHHQHHHQRQSAAAALIMPPPPHTHTTHLRHHVSQRHARPTQAVVGRGPACQKLPQTAAQLPHVGGGPVHGVDAATPAGPNGQAPAAGQLVTKRWMRVWRPAGGIPSIKQSTSHSSQSLGVRHLGRQLVRATLGTHTTDQDVAEIGSQCSSSASSRDAQHIDCV